MAIETDALQSNVVRVWVDVDAKLRVAPYVRSPRGGSEAQRDVVLLVVGRLQVATYISTRRSQGCRFEGITMTGILLRPRCRFRGSRHSLAPRRACAQP